MRFRRPILVAAIAASMLVTACGAGELATVDVSLRLPQGCATPDLAIGSDIWAPETPVPPSWTGLSAVQGTLVVNGDRALFTAEDGTRLSYSAAHDRTNPGCSATS